MHPTVSDGLTEHERGHMFAVRHVDLDSVLLVYRNQEVQDLWETIVGSLEL